MTTGKLDAMAKVAVLVVMHVLASVSFANSATTVFSSATPYVQRGQSAGFFNTTHPIIIEDFEDNAVHPFIAEINGEILPPNYFSNLTDSVDGDDGVLDGSGNNGRSFFSEQRSIRIKFARPVPAAGLVWTDGDPLSASVILEAFDAAGNSLGAQDYGKLGDADITGETSEDRFLGAMNLAGIGGLLVTNTPDGSGMEIDHVQWYEFVPEPTCFALVAYALGCIPYFRRRLDRG
jgi:hypothetical protein